MIRRSGTGSRPSAFLPSFLPSLLLPLLVLLLAACGSDPDPGPDPGPDHHRPSPIPSSIPSPIPAPPSDRWRPPPGTAWQWQLSGKVDTSVDVPVYDIDGFENDAATVARLHAAGRKVICYVNAGAWENFRPDRVAFPTALLGLGNGWSGERWLDIRRLDLLRPLMAQRFDMCRTKGFDGVEPDLMDAYTNRTGFPLTAADQLAYNRMLAGLAHERGMSVGLKNDLEQIPELVGDFDFAVNEECAQNDECDELTPFITAGKAVFHTEYSLATTEFCPTARRLRLSSMLKHLNLDAWRQPC
ncbi:endo alpha-1,4 polygalactosaminidase [Streptomyces sp. So13.3]|uniref:endo alpha-1,4 polygalactosaminidase n=1 Tax=Streptomyces TaxID=1883 RepID=UPI00110651F8|nr:MULTISPECIES: endo alpha-1,4 polygalactosaminidase [Streptomyces]MCZ4096030.1 endo alpha-1,4 polygalactosaminidase [Streptomyces sp. H39-C1]QNA74079.1 endo alpha-1,4 polygalactosaminidase [Streptomyces sp. So13.3]